MDNPGGSPVHYGVVHYGLDPRNLNETAKSPIRVNPSHASATFRVRLDDLKPGTALSSNSLHPVNRTERAGKLRPAQK